jgi:hypothetical protein
MASVMSLVLCCTFALTPLHSSHGSVTGSVAGAQIAMPSESIDPRTKLNAISTDS